MVHPSIWMRQDEMRASPEPETNIGEVEQRQLQATLAKLSKYIL